MIRSAMAMISGSSDEIMITPIFFLHISSSVL